MANCSPNPSQGRDPHGPQTRTAGGVAAVLQGALKHCDGTWIAWSGNGRHNLPPGVERPDAGNPSLRFLSLSDSEVSDYYNGFCNQLLWPICHGFTEKCRYRELDWRAYATVNRRFASATLGTASDSSLVWVHDYHLSLTPQLIRSEGFSHRIGFFWHIPFPKADVFRQIPWWREILHGLLGSDLIGFHTQAYVDNFLDCVEELPTTIIDRGECTVHTAGRAVKVAALPVGVNVPMLEQLAACSNVAGRAASIRRRIGSEHLAVSVERLDYTKGVLERLQALGLLYERVPSFRGRLSLLQIAAPSREGIPEYQDLRVSVDREVRRINRKFGDRGWQPIHYVGEGQPCSEVVAAYRSADFAIVTPIKDGMNLVAKEYVAANLGRVGALVLSRHAGAAHALGAGAILVEPADPMSIACGIERAVEMAPSEKRRKFELLRHEVRCHDLYWWTRSFIRELMASPPRQASESRQALYGTV